MKRFNVAAVIGGLLVNFGAGFTANAASRGYSIPLIDLASETNRQVIVDREPGQYLGHPATVLLEDGKTIVCVYPKGHGRGAIILKRSSDAGLTWSDRLPVPASWATSKETPTIHRVVDAQGKKRLIVWSGLYPARLAVSEDDGQTWSELKPPGDWGGIVVMSALEPLKTGAGNYLAMFHDDGRYFTATPKPTKPITFTLYKTFSNDGGLTWSTPESIFARSDVHLCEPGIIRSPDGKEMAVLLRENSRRKNSHVIFSRDEGKTWSEPRELPGALTGDRHTGKYAPDGRLFISFRDTTLESPTKGDWVAWVGKYEDIVAGKEGQYRVRLMHNYKNGDCAYPGVEVLPDGTFVTTTYGHWTTNEMPYIASVRLKLAELDAKAKSQPQAAGPKPNIMIILSDDMGFSDLGCYGGEINTPNLDKLAANGLRFTQFYNAARCCPTRASLLTGLYPHQAGVGHMMDDRGLEGYQGELNQHCVTIAEALKPAGYRSYAVGKWHVTHNISPNGSKHDWPLQRGFDAYYGTLHGAGSYFDPSTLMHDNSPITAATDPDYPDEAYYYTDAISDHAARFVSDHAAKHAGEPFFMYVAFTAAHWPLHAKEADIAKYRGRYDAGYRPIRRARFEKANKLGLISSEWQLSRQAGAWRTVTNKAWEARCMEVYAAQVDCMDQGIGRILAALEKSGQMQNTLVLFLEDNGGCAEAIGRTGHAARAGKPSLAPLRPDSPQQGSQPKQTRDGWPVLTGTGVMPGPRDTFISYGRAWANVSNTPFREYKHWVHEGGIATPLIVHWPAHIAARGELRHQPGHLIDIMATCLEVAGAQYPAENHRSKTTPLEGRSLVPAFANQPIQREALYWEHEGNRAIRIGDWKLVAKGPAGRWELYNLLSDRTELNNLAAKEPNRVKELAGKWEQWAKRADVLPWIWSPQYGEPAKAGQALKQVLKKGKRNP